MTLEEKVGQLTLYSAGITSTGPTITDKKYLIEGVKSGRIGSLFNAFTVDFTTEMQKLAMEHSRLKIPLLFGFDVIHGYRTVFPVPLAEAASWDMEAVAMSARISTTEAAAGGLHWTYAPMVDISRDPRWGRVVEGSGEDACLGSLIAAARVRAIQGRGQTLGIDELLATVKHFAAYGAAQAGRDYHTTDLSEITLRDVYLPPFKAAVDAGVASVMTGFNELDGVPASAHKWLLSTILRKEWGFKGFVVSDYTSIVEMIPHGYAKDRSEAARLSALAGVDVDMEGGVFLNELPKLVEAGKVPLTVVDEAVRRVLRAKLRLGLFQDPYRYSNKEREAKTLLSKPHLEAARDVARKSIVLLKNERGVLPLKKTVKSIALIGPLADNRKDILGSWWGFGDEKHSETVLQGIREKVPGAKVSYARGCGFTEPSEAGFAEAVRLARESDVVVAVLGESEGMSGEAASRSEIGLPGVQEKLLQALHATGKPVVLVLMNGRPLTIEWADKNVPSILEAWFLGTRTGGAVADVLFGDYNPSGKLPITFPRRVGQIPIYYAHKNTGRPALPGSGKYVSKYLDVENSPLYPFGHGLSYTTFAYADLDVKTSEKGVAVEVTVKNTGGVAGGEVAQLYIQDEVGRVTRPVKELKGFRKVFLKPGETKRIAFLVTRDELSFHYRDDDGRVKRAFEPGFYRVWVGGDSLSGAGARFELD